MPAILQPADYERWLGIDRPSEPDPHDLLITFPSEPMKMWPISKRVNSPRNDDEDLLAEITERAFDGFQARSVVRTNELNAIGEPRRTGRPRRWR